MRRDPTEQPWPDVDVVVATRDRPELLQASLAAIVGQDYQGTINVLVVFDQVEPDPTVELDASRRRVRVLSNTRTAGLAGSRNTGMLAARSSLVAFCDDDDTWLAHKLTEQVEALHKHPDAILASCSIQVRYGDELTVRRLGTDSIGFADLLASRLMELHPSTFLMRREAVVEKCGLVAEDIPGSYGEDYEFLLRITRHSSIVNVDAVGVEILWHPQSYFFSRWDTIVAGLTWLLDKYPEFETVSTGYARISGQVAFAHAAGGRTRQALTWVARCLRKNPREPRGHLAAAVALRVVSAGTVERFLHRRGRGI